MKTPLTLLRLTAILFISLTSIQETLAHERTQGTGRSIGVAITSIPFMALEEKSLDHGIIVEDVAKGGSAMKAGIQKGDIIVSVDGKAAYSPKRLSWLIRKGDSEKVSLQVFRDGSFKTIEVAVENNPSPKPSSRHRMHHRASAYLGIQMQPLTPDLREAFGVPESLGVLIAKNKEGGPAENAGLKAGDIIIKIDRKNIHDGHDIHRAMNYFSPGDDVEITVIRDHQKITVSAKLGKAPASDHHRRHSMPGHQWKSGDWKHHHKKGHHPSHDRW